MEKLLSGAEIAEVLKEAAHPKYTIENLYHIASKKLDVVKVSRKGLILIHGDEHTGMEHIQIRHSITSRKLFEKDNTFDNPTKFNLATIEYLIVADVIFAQSNLNNEKNKHPDLFDCYIGYFKHSEDKVFKYTLILYKSTGIIHTFFLSESSKPYNKKIKLPLRQGWCSSKVNLLSGTQEYSIKYYNLRNRAMFTVLLRCMPAIRKEKWYLVVNDIAGTPIFTHFLPDEERKHIAILPFRMAILNFQDLSIIDKTIKKIIQGTYEFETNFGRYSEYKYPGIP